MSTLAFFGRIGWQEALVILAIVMLLMGRRVPDIARSLGRTLVEFRHGLRS